MRLATREEIYDIDKEAASRFNLPPHLLIENAGRALAASFELICKEQKWGRKKRIGVWCGRGNNGADGRVLARILGERHYNVKVLEDENWAPSDFDIIVDAFFGVGLNRDIASPVCQQIQKINRAKKVLIAIDIPTGLDANRGIVWGAAIEATWTLTILPAKPGLFLQEGPRYSGKIRGVAIGFPKELLQEKANSVFLVGAASARRILPFRRATSNKSHFGKLLVIAGSPGMEGSAQLVCEAAARMGCGYVTLCSLSAEVYKRARPDFLQLSLVDFFKNDLTKYTAVVVGPGLGLSEDAHQVVQHLLGTHSKVLVDADALTLLSQKSAVELPAEWLLTPHAGELSRLLKTPAKELEENRLGAVKQAVNELSAHILFKGFRTVLGCKHKFYIIGSGNVALAKAGSGDVLAGFIGSLMAQGLPTAQAGVLGAYLHGRIADDWLRRGHSTRTLMASDLAEMLDASLRSLKKAR